MANKLVSFALVLILGIFLQVLFVSADVRDTPIRAAKDFARAYVGYDKDGMTARLCSENLVVDDVNVIDAYLYRARQKAHDRGYSLNYMKDGLYHVETEVLNESYTEARVHLSATRKSPLRQFFGGTADHVEETFELVKENGKWKVCGGPFSLPEA
jgi:hypothetical protein